jgi:hypothetical protein
MSPIAYVLTALSAYDIGLILPVHAALEALLGFLGAQWQATVGAWRSRRLLSLAVEFGDIEVKGPLLPTVIKAVEHVEWFAINLLEGLEVELETRVVPLQPSVLLSNAADPDSRTRGGTIRTWLAEAG